MKYVNYVDMLLGRIQPKKLLLATAMVAAIIGKANAGAADDEITPSQATAFQPAWSMPAMPSSVASLGYMPGRFTAVPSLEIASGVFAQFWSERRGEIAAK
jgi:hypothetical protein